MPLAWIMKLSSEVYRGQQLCLSLNSGTLVLQTPWKQSHDTKNKDLYSLMEVNIVSLKSTPLFLKATVTLTLFSIIIELEQKRSIYSKPMTQLRHNLFSYWLSQMFYSVAAPQPVSCCWVGALKCSFSNSRFKNRVQQTDHIICYFCHHFGWS